MFAFTNKSQTTLEIANINKVHCVVMNGSLEELLTKSMSLKFYLIQNVYKF